MPFLCHFKTHNIKHWWTAALSCISQHLINVENVAMEKSTVTTLLCHLLNVSSVQTSDT